jgi:hypothetical protein
MSSAVRNDVPIWLGPVRQTAFVVDDIEAAAQQWVDTHGIGPWFLYDVTIEGTTYRGEEVPMRARMGLAQSGGQQIELIQPHPDTPSIYNEFVASAGRGVHHVCYWADLRRAVEHFRASGAEVVQFGKTAAGNEFVYLSGSCGIPYIELVDPQGAMREFFDTIERAAQEWDGTQPLR